MVTSGALSVSQMYSFSIHSVFWTPDDINLIIIIVSANSYTWRSGKDVKNVLAAACLARSIPNGLLHILLLHLQWIIASDNV